ncbi:hypothetical protein RUM44_013654 [Polyplax serrata]|uniref:Uncharacterized protein n=1 Tax=Polyplax serrata TaxID=468196 RepID=A0ABR1BIP7_POLSC
MGRREEVGEERGRDQSKSVVTSQDGARASGKWFLNKEGDLLHYVQSVPRKHRPSGTAGCCTRNEMSAQQEATRPIPSFPGRLLFLSRRPNPDRRASQKNKVELSHC